MIALCLLYRAWAKPFKAYRCYGLCSRMVRIFCRCFLARAVISLHCKHHVCFLVLAVWTYLWLCCQDCETCSHIHSSEPVLNYNSVHLSSMCTTFWVNNEVGQNRRSNTLNRTQSVILQLYQVLTWENLVLRDAHPLHPNKRYDNTLASAKGTNMKLMMLSNQAYPQFLTKATFIV